MKFKLITLDRYNACNSTVDFIEGDTPALAWEQYWKGRLQAEDSLEGQALNDAWEQICREFQKNRGSLREGPSGLWGADGEEFSWLIIQE